MPTTTDFPWEIGKFDEDPVSMYLSDVCTVMANLVGIPAISIHAGNSEEGLPIGFQLFSSNLTEDKLLDVAKTVAYLA